MKKRYVIRKKSILTLFCVFIFIFSLFRIGNVFATNIFSVEDVSIVDKTGSADGVIASFNGGVIKGNVTFHKLGDSVTYKLKIKNNDDRSYVINSIEENNENANIVYEYENNNGVKIDANSSKDILIKAIYKNELNDISKRLSESKVSFSINYLDQNNNSESSDITITNGNMATSLTNNPFTGDNIYIYFMLLIVSILGILIFGFNIKFKNKKVKRISLIVISSALLLPIGAKAYDVLFVLKLDNTYKIYDKLVVSYDVGNNTYQAIVPYNSLFNVDDPHKQGYVFDGWEFETGEDFDVNTRITEDINLVADLKKLNSAIVINVSDEFEEKTMKEISISFNLDNISVSDVLNQYSLDNGVTWNEYTEPIIVEENVTVQARTVVLSDNYIIGEKEKDVVKIIVGETTLKSGYDINNYMLSLVNNKSDIKSIKIATKEQFDAIKNSLTVDNVVSTEESLQKTYLWFSSGTIYLYTKSEKIHLNENSSKLFFNLNELTDIDLSKFDTVNVTNMDSMFEGCAKLAELDLSGFDTTNVNTMSNMFAYDASLNSLDVSNFVTSNVTNMSGMFQGLSAITSLDLSKLDTVNVLNMSGMFQWDSNLTSLDVSKFNTKKVTNMSSMFRGVSSITTLNLSSFNTSSVNNMSYMFANCRNITNLNISSFDTSNVLNMSFMFQWCGFSSINLSNFVTTKVTNMKSMFASVQNVTELDLSSFNTSNVTGFDSMFSEDSYLTKIYASNNFIVSSNATSTNMFKEDTLLVGGNGTAYDSLNINGEYARIDGTLPGYFTAK